MFKVEVGKGPLMFMSYYNLVKEINGTTPVEELENIYYAILYDFGMPIGCGRLKLENNSYTIDNIMILSEFSTPNLLEDIRDRLQKKYENIGSK